MSVCLSATCYVKHLTCFAIPLNRTRAMRHTPMCGSKNFMRARVLPVFLVSGVETLSTMLQPSRRHVCGN
jgi:hypothetical protein